jgi:hypothetical protein
MPMNEALTNALLAPLAVLLYSSGLLFWPIRRWVRRNKIRGKVLWLVFLVQLISYAVVACCSIFIRLEHFYYWFILLIELNILFTIAALVALIRDVRYERRMEAEHAV